MSSATSTMASPQAPRRNSASRLVSALGLPLLAMFTAFLLGALVIFFTNWLTTHSVTNSLNVVVEAYAGLFRGAFTKERGFSETLVATVPYILLSLGLAIGFKSGLFNIGVEGQFYVGAVAAAWFGQVTHSLPAIIHLPLTLFIGALGGAIWAAIPGYLKAKTGAHEVINTIMMNYIAFRLTEYLISGPVKDKVSTATQTPSVSAAAQVWTMYEIPARLKDPLNALMVAILFAVTFLLLARWLLGTEKLRQRFPQKNGRILIMLGSSLVVGVLVFFLLPPLTQAWWPFKDQYDRLHTGLLIALGMSVVVWWLMWRTTLGFELRTAGANPNAAHYAGVNVTRNIVLAMAFSGALAGLAGTIEVVAVSTCRCMQLFFSSGYGFDSIAVALLAKNNPFGIVLSSLLFGAMRNGADLMELNSGVSKYIISLVQALALLFVAAPGMVRWIYRLKEPKVTEVEAPLTRGWGG